MTGGYVNLVKPGKKNVYTKKQPKIAKFRKVIRGPCTGLSSLVGRSRYLKLLYKAGWKDTVNTTTLNLTRFFRMNSIYDPDFLAITPPTKNKSVEGLSELATLFQRYQVYGCKAIVSIQNMGEDALRVVLSTTNDATIWAASILTSDIASRAGAKSKLLGPTGSSNDKVTLSYYVDPRKAIGVTKATYGQDGFSAAINDSPFINSCLAITVGPQIDSFLSTGCNVVYDIRFVYGTRLYDTIEDLDQ